jgi:hypothetical protein
MKVSLGNTLRLGAACLHLQTCSVAGQLRDNPLPVYCQSDSTPNAPTTGLLCGGFNRSKGVGTKGIEGKATLVTGAASGIGRAIALAFAQEEAKLTIADIQTEPLNAVAREIENTGAPCKLRGARGKRAIVQHRRRAGDALIPSHRSVVMPWLRPWPPQDPARPGQASGSIRDSGCSPAKSWKI